MLKFQEKIKYCISKNISLAGMTSIMFHFGLTNYKYGEVRKLIFKECQRIDSNKFKYLND